MLPVVPVWLAPVTSVLSLPVDRSSSVASACAVASVVVCLGLPSPLGAAGWVVFALVETYLGGDLSRGLATRINNSWWRPISLKGFPGWPLC